MARLGANVTAIDPLTENIDSARSHAADNEDLKTLQYKCTTIEELNCSSLTKFDLVVASEVIEHVENPSVFIKNCCSLVKVIKSNNAHFDIFVIKLFLLKK